MKRMLVGWIVWFAFVAILAVLIRVVDIHRESSAAIPHTRQEKCVERSAIRD